MFYRIYTAGNSFIRDKNIIEPIGRDGKMPLFSDNSSHLMNEIKIFWRNLRIVLLDAINSS